VTLPRWLQPAPGWLSAGWGRWPLAAVALLAAALLPGESAATAALRAAALLGALGLAAAALRRAPAAERPLALLDRRPLGRESGVALVEVQGRRLLVGYAPSGVALLADLSSKEGS
jgi:flagellar protein FliO/FliZ